LIRNPSFNEYLTAGFNNGLIDSGVALALPQHCHFQVQSILVGSSDTVIGAIPFWPRRGGPALGPLFCVEFAADVGQPDIEQRAIGACDLGY
jgi:hypothetical protein